MVGWDDCLQQSWPHLRWDQLVQLLLSVLLGAKVLHLDPGAVQEQSARLSGVCGALQS